MLWAHGGRCKGAVTTVLRLGAQTAGRGQWAQGQDGTEVGGFPKIIGIVEKKMETTILGLGLLLG